MGRALKQKARKTSAQKRQTHKDAGWGPRQEEAPQRERGCSEQSSHGSSPRDFSFPNLSQPLAGSSLASLSRLDLTVSLSNQGCQLYALAILGPPFAPSPGQSDTPGASQETELLSPGCLAILSFISHLSVTRPNHVQSHSCGHFLATLTFSVPLISED